MTKELKDFTIGDYAAIGLLVAFFVAAFAIVGLVMGGVILEEPVEDPASAPVVVSIPTPEPTPEPVVLGGEDRRACGMYWETYEWALIDRRGTPVYAWMGVPDASVYYFTDDLEDDGGFVTLKNGCALYESSSIFRKDAHKDFDVEQFRVGEGDLFHNGEAMNLQ